MKNKLIKTILLTSLSISQVYSYEGFAKETLHVREQPFLDAKINTILAPNTKVNIIERLHINNNSTWYKVKRGYISAELIKKDATTLIKGYRARVIHGSNKKCYEYISKIKELKHIKVCNLNESKSKNIEVKKNIPIPVIKKQLSSSIVPIIKKNSIEQTKAHLLLEKNSSKKEIFNKNDKKIKTSLNKYFIGLNIGYTKLSSNYDAINGSFSNISSHDDNGINFTLDLGYNINKSSFTSISYNQINLNDANFYNYLLSYNYKINKLPYNMYLGAVGGISYIKTKKSPIKNLIGTDVKGRAYAYGLQIGAQHKLSNNLSLLTQYQYLKAKHTTNIISGTAKSNLTRDNFNNISLGVRWLFGN